MPSRAESGSIKRARTSIYVEDEDCEEAEAAPSVDIDVTLAAEPALPLPALGSGPPSPLACSGC